MAGGCAPVTNNEAAYFRECRTLAEQGDAIAQYDLGWSYEAGGLVPQDYAEAAKWYRQAAEQGNAYGQTALGNLYYEGWGVEQNYTSAANWFRKAAEQGDATGQFSLGWAYEQGDGVLQDYVLAHMWYNLAAAQGADVAAKDRDRVAAKMTSDQIAEAQRLAREWKPTK
jgi:TPR repeat protein